MTKYIVKSYLALVNRFEAFAKNLGSFGLAVIYTIGHIWIAILCAAYIFDAPLNLAAIDAFIEPVINGFWFYALHKLCSEILGKITLTIVYTLGHIFIATMCAVIIFSASVNLAAIDAFVEPIINAFWFYFLHSFYGTYSQKREVSYE